MPAEALAHADQVMAGEGESSILDVIEGRRSEKIVRCHPPKSLDDVPFPDYSILKTPCKSANILTTRGCPFRCTFCTTSRMPGFRNASACATASFPSAAKLPSIFLFRSAAKTVSATALLYFSLGVTAHSSIS